MQKWEYFMWFHEIDQSFGKIRKDHAEVVTAKLNIFGRQGWELQSSYTLESNGYSYNQVFIFRRPLQEETNPQSEALPSGLVADDFQSEPNETGNETGTLTK